MVSSEGEHVKLSKPVRIVPQVELWLAELSNEMRATLKKLVADCLKEEQLDPGKYPSQILCLSEEIRFCRDVEELLNAGTSPETYKTQLLQQLEQFTSTKVDDSVLKLKLKSLILDLIHHIGVLDELNAGDHKGKSCWIWQKQLRFYYENGTVVIRQANATFSYTFEYQGNAPKLVHTPLTDKCYLTLTQGWEHISWW